ncbi:MAG: glycosyltransferase family 39 protein [Pseudomonadota bacterium]
MLGLRRFQVLVAEDANWAQRFAVCAIIILLSRIATLVLGNYDLGQDEAQYWFWSKDLQFGYFSKPPLIAWVIATTTGIFGSSEAAIRLAAPLFHTATATILFVFTKSLFGPREAFWVGLSWLILPAVLLSGVIISTDALLMFFWSSGLLLFFKLCTDDPDANDLPSSVLLGISCGLGFLAKYAMIYFPACAALALAVAPSFRQRVSIKAMLVAAFIAALIALPNIIWNVENEFQTVAHTAANANLDRELFHFGSFASFFFSQFAVVGPFLFPVMLFSFYSSRKLTARDTEKALLAFSLPILILICIQAFLSRAHANWAAAAYPAALVLSVGLAGRNLGDKTLRRGLLPLIIAGNAVNVVGLIVVSFALIAPGQLQRVELSSALRPLQGWKQHGDDVMAFFEETDGIDAIVADDRAVIASLNYYADYPDTVLAFNSNNKVEHHYEAFYAYDPSSAKDILYVTTRSDGLGLKDRFETTTFIGESTARVGGGGSRTLYVFKAEGPIGR